MKLLVTGGAGFIGSAFIRTAISKGHSVINVDSLTYAANLESLSSVSGHENYTFEKQDIRDAAAMAHLFTTHQPDAVLHLAAESHVDRSHLGKLAFDFIMSAQTRCMVIWNCPTQLLQKTLPMIRPRLIPLQKRHQIIS